MLVAIKFGGFENITIWQRFNLEILLEESGWGPYFIIWWLLILAKCINSPISPNKSSTIIYRITVKPQYIFLILVWQLVEVIFTHGYSGLPSARLAGYESSPTSDLALTDHLQYNPGRPPGWRLAHHTLRYITSLQRIIQSQPADVGMSTCGKHTRCRQQT